MSRHLMLVTTRSTELPAPVVGQSIIYPKADGLWYSRDENGVETLMSSGTPISGGIDGSGTINKIAKFTAATIVGDSIIFDDGTNIGIGTITGLAKLSINGGLHVGGDSDPGDNNLTVDGIIISGLINGQTISAVANFTGTVTIATSLNITGSLQVDSIINDTGLAHGTYTPTLTAVSNINSFTAFECQYSRIGNIVTVSGKITVDANSAGVGTRLRISLPIASNIGAEEDCGGVAVNGDGGSRDSAAIKGDATNNAAELIWNPLTTVDSLFFFTFQYQII